MARPSAKTSLVPRTVEPLIHVIRGLRVMLDHDLALLYGMTTAAVNQAVDRNTDRFPQDFSFLLNSHEWSELIPAPRTPRRGGRRKLPRVFTEQGVAMLSSVLRSPTAVRVNIEIMRAFVRIRRLLATPGELISQLQQLAETVRLHDTQIRKIADVLQKMIEPPAETEKRRFGFHPPGPA